MGDLCYFCEEPLPGVQHVIYWDFENKRAAHMRCRAWEQQLDKHPLLRWRLRFQHEGVGL